MLAFVGSCVTFGVCVAVFRHLSQTGDVSGALPLAILATMSVFIIAVSMKSVRYHVFVQSNT